MRQPEDFKKAVQEKGITFWPSHPCSICEVVVGYEFHNGEPFYNSGCGCSNRDSIHQRTWEDVAISYNMQDNPEVIKRMDEFFGFE